jgi:hypothetical protein
MILTEKKILTEPYKVLLGGTGRERRHKTHKSRSHVDPIKGDVYAEAVDTLGLACVDFMV